MNNESIYLVSREEYKSVIERLIPEKVRTEQIEDRTFSLVKIFSVNTNDCICSRKTYCDRETPEEYYIFKLPEADEWGEAIPKKKLVLETKEEVQNLFNFISQLAKEKEKEQNG